MFGKLTTKDIPHEWFTIGGTLFMIFMGLAFALLLQKKKRWGWLWHEWLTSTDPKKIGTMYMIFAIIMFFRGMVDVILAWLQQAIAVDNQGFLSADHFQQIVTSHGDIMVFFVTMGFFFGLMNWIIPLQIGARDLSFPIMNSLGLWMTVAGGILINIFFAVGGNFANTGWLAVVPLSELEFSPGPGVDYLIWSLQLSGVGSLIAGINFIVTIVKRRAPGMTFMKLPLFTWTSFCAMILVISAFPVLTATTTLLWLDRFLDTKIFTDSFGGNQMLYFNFIWMWGHPEVYILVLPAFGMFSEIVSTFSQKKIFGYTSQVIAAWMITGVSFLVWLHHFFTMGSGADVNSFFGIATLFIAIPSGVLVFNLIMTMYKGRIRFTSPMYFLMGFVVIFILGGMAGLLLANPPADFQLHNSLFLVAHFHSMIVGVALFGIFAGTTYWFPKIFGFKLNDELGKKAFWCWFIGFFVSFLPLYWLGLMGATRRLDSYTASTGWQPLFITSVIGFCIISAGVVLQVIQVIVSIVNRKKEGYRDVTGDPWDGRTLEWYTSSPPPFYNFAIVPQVDSIEPFWDMKQKGLSRSKEYEEIEMPKNTAVGLYISLFSFFVAFGVVWHIYWLIALGTIAVIITVIKLSFNEHTEYHLSAKEVERLEQSRGENA